MKLREYQSKTIEQSRSLLRAGVLRQLIYGPAGSGKSVIMAGIIKAALVKHKRVVFVVNKITLVRQFCKHLRKSGIVHGVVQGDSTWGVDRDILVCSIQTLINRGYPDTDVVLQDEAHSLSDSYIKMHEHYASLGVPVIGFTATPFTKGLGKYFDELIISATIPELIALGYLVDCEIFAPTTIDRSLLPISNGDYEEEAAAKVIDKPKLVGDIIKHWKELANGESTICFAQNIVHSKHICAEFLANGITAEHVDCNTSSDDRDLIYARYESGETTVLCNVDVCSEGFDAPRCSVVILAKVTKNLTRFIQRLCRGSRPRDGKMRWLVIDHSTSSHELGYPTDELPLMLDDGQPKEKGKKQEPKPKLAKLCSNKACCFLIPPGVYPCPKCGFAPEAQNKVFTGEGTLTKLERKWLFSPEELQEFWSSCLGLAEKRSKSRQWAKFLYHDTTRQWPNGLQDIPIEPCQKVLDRDRHNRIRYAKSKFRSAT